MPDDPATSTTLFAFPDTDKMGSSINAATFVFNQLNKYEKVCQTICLEKAVAGSSMRFRLTDFNPELTKKLEIAKQNASNWQTLQARAYACTYGTTTVGGQICTTMLEKIIAILKSDDPSEDQRRQTLELVTEAQSFFMIMTKNIANTQPSLAALLTKLEGDADFTLSDATILGYKKDLRNAAIQCIASNPMISGAIAKILGDYMDEACSSLDQLQRACLQIPGLASKIEGAHVAALAVWELLSQQLDSAANWLQKSQAKPGEHLNRIDVTASLNAWSTIVKSATDAKAQLE